jgi:hypothetical protein
MGSFSISTDDFHCSELPLFTASPVVVSAFVLTQYTELGRSVEGCHFEPACTLFFFCTLQQLYHLPLLALLVFLPHVLRVNTNACAKKNRCSAACKHSTAQHSTRVCRCFGQCYSKRLLLSCTAFTCTVPWQLTHVAAAQWCSLWYAVLYSAMDQVHVLCLL